MGKSKDYIIPFGGLPVGKHRYDYKIGGSFFEELDNSEVKKAALSIVLDLNKQSSMLIIDIAITGTVKVPCDRCTDYFDLQVEGNNQLIIKLGEEQVSDDEMVFISEKETEIDVSQYIYEYIMLSLPIRRVHPDNKKGESTCNKEVMKNYNKYVIKEEKEKPIDPRWEKLAGLKLNS